MAELRYNPLLNDYIIVASTRAKRPVMPKEYCPFCPGSGRVPDEGYEVYKYDNDFPIMTQEFSELTGYEDAFFKAKSTYGKCEVILYHQDHTITLPQLPESHIVKIVELWKNRFFELSQDKNIQYVFIFENRGPEAGVTMPHPHGQLYAFSWLPKQIEAQLINSKKYYEENGSCLLCDLLKNEQRANQRMITENEHFAAYLPYFTAFPYGVHITAKEHIGSFFDFNDEMTHSFAAILKQVTGAFDTLFDRLFPYMMCIYQTPVNTFDASEYYHFHVEFFPPLRAANVQYFRASAETGAGAYCNATSPEDKAEELRNALNRFNQ